MGCGFFSPLGSVNDLENNRFFVLKSICKISFIILHMARSIESSLL